MASSSGAIRAGRAFVQLFADSNALYRTLEKAEQRMKQFGGFATKVGLGVAGMGATLVTPIAKLFTDAVGEGAQVDSLSKRWRMSAESVSTLKGAFAQAGVSGEEFADTMDGLSSKINDAAYANEKLWESASAPSGKALWGKDKTEQLYAFADAFAKLSDQAEQVDIAKKFGMLPLIDQLRKGSAGIKEFQDAAVKNGDAMSGEDAKAAATIQKEYNRTLIAVKSTLLEVGKALLPTGRDFAEVGGEIRNSLRSVREWIQNNKQIIVTVVAVAGAMLGGGLAVAALGSAITIVAPIIGGLIIAVKAVAAVVAALISPIGLAVIAFTAIGVGIAYIVSQTEAGQAAIADLKNGFAQAAEFLKESWTGITNAFKAGDWSLAFKIGVATMDVAWKQFAFYLTAAWVGVKNDFVDSWEDATGAIAKLMIDLGATVLRIIMGTIRKLVDGFNSVAGAIDESLKITVPGLMGDEDIKTTAAEWKKGVDDVTEEEKKRRGEFRKGQLEAAKLAKDSAKAELDDLKKLAEEAAKNAGKKPKAEDDSKKPPPALPSVAALSALSKGTFASASIEQSLGYGDTVGSKQLAEAERTADGVEKSNELLTKIVDKPGTKFS